MNVKEIRRKNLRAFARSVGGVTQLAERLGKSQSQISHLIGTNPVKNIGDRLAAEIEKVFSKPSGWLDHDHLGVQEESIAYHVSSGRRAYHQIPLITWHEVPAWVQPGHTPTKNHLHYVITNMPVGEQSFALRIEGDSMEAPNGISFPNGSIIVVDPDERASNGSYVLAKQNTNSQIVFKQFIIDGSRRYLKPLNPRYPLVEISPQAIICGVVRLMLLELK